MESIANQTYTNMDVIVIDDGSDVDPVEIINNFDWKDMNVRYIRNSKNEGKWSCLNKVINMTDSKWYMIQDADDYAFPWKAQSQLECLLETNTFLNLAGYIPIQVNDTHRVPVLESLEHFHIKGQEIMQCASMSLTNPSINHNYTGRHNLHNGASMFSRNFHEIGFRFHPPAKGLRLARSEDSDYNLRATLQFGRTSWLTKPCYSYRLGSGHPEGSF